MRKIRTNSPATRGFAMIEALIALLIFSFAALGLVGLQASMVRATGSAKYRAEAAYLVNDLVGTMWADGARSADLIKYRDGCDSHAPCKNWKDKVASLLPGSTATLVIDPNSGELDITLTWQVPGEGSHAYTTTTAINANVIASP